MHHSHRSALQIRRWLARFLPEKGHKRLLDFLPLIMLGVVRSSSCHLNRIACAIPLGSTAKSALQRVRRWICRTSFTASELLPLVSCHIVTTHAMERIVISIDRTEWKHANFLYAAISYRGRAIPIALMLLPGPKATHIDELRQLLAQVARAIPPGTDAVIAGDREFGNIPAIRAISAYGWDYCLRMRKNTIMRNFDGEYWQAYDRYPDPGGRILLSDVWVTGREYGPVNVATIWETKEDEPWVLVSELPPTQLRALYRRRMCIEEMFSDLKKRGFDLEATRLRKPRRLLNLAALLSLTYVWLLMVATYIVKRGWRREVDSAAKRALSYTQIALRFILYQPPDRVERIFTNIARKYTKSEG